MPMNLMNIYQKQFIRMLIELGKNKSVFSGLLQRCDESIKAAVNKL